MWLILLLYWADLPLFEELEYLERKTFKSSLTFKSRIFA